MTWGGSFRTSGEPLKAGLREMTVKSQRLLYPALVFWSSPAS